MRYFLDFVDVGGTVRVDNTGMELSDLEQAVREARRILREVAEDTPVMEPTTIRVFIREQVSGPVLTTTAIDLLPDVRAS